MLSMAISAGCWPPPTTRLIEDGNTLAKVAHCIVSTPSSFRGSKSNAPGEKIGENW